MLSHAPANTSEALGKGYPGLRLGEDTVLADDTVSRPDHLRLASTDTGFRESHMKD